MAEFNYCGSFLAAKAVAGFNSPIVHYPNWFLQVHYPEVDWVYPQPQRIFPERYVNESLVELVIKILSYSKVVFKLSDVNRMF